MVMPRQIWLDMINPSVLATLHQHAILIVNVHDHGCESDVVPFPFLVEMLPLCSITGFSLGRTLPISSCFVNVMTQGFGPSLSAIRDFPTVHLLQHASRRSYGWEVLVRTGLWWPSYGNPASNSIISSTIRQLYVSPNSEAIIRRLSAFINRHVHRAPRTDRLNTTPIRVICLIGKSKHEKKTANTVYRDLPRSM
jgi:hypothetical protein